MYQAWGKRLFDILFSLIALVSLFPLFLVVVVLIKIFDPGPVLFKQVRVGRGGRRFVFYKFRSMPVNTSDIPSHKIGNISISPVGKMIRRTNIDELPQLFNIIKGDMSIVGPRPPIESQVELIKLRVENESINCRPGLTGLAQINSYDGMPVTSKADLDARYSIKITFVGDIVIMIKTFLYLLKPPPVY